MRSLGCGAPLFVMTLPASVAPGCSTGRRGDSGLVPGSLHGGELPGKKEGQKRNERRGAEVLFRADGLGKKQVHKRS